MDPEQLDRQFASLCSLTDSTRRRLYDYVAAQGCPVSRDQASAALGIDRSLVAYHLDRLLEEGLLVASFARPEGRSGPGAGRPAKYYARADGEFAASVPPRDYGLAAELLARSAERDPTGTVKQALHEAAAEVGHELVGAGDDGSGRRDLPALLARQGFEPYTDGAVVRLRNCPFHRLAQEHTELICGMNLALLQAVADDVGEVEARLEPLPGRCCVAFFPR